MSSEPHHSNNHGNQRGSEEIRSQRIARLRKLRKNIRKVTSKTCEPPVFAGPQAHKDKLGTTSKPAIALKPAKQSEIELVVRGASKSSVGTEMHVNLGSGASSSNGPRAITFPKEYSFENNLAQCVTVQYSTTGTNS